VFDLHGKELLEIARGGGFSEAVLLGILDMCAKIGSGYILLSLSGALMQAEMTGSSSTDS
jgi:hypothetical protein